MKKKKKVEKVKLETLEAFLARGGQITVCPVQSSEDLPHKVKPSPVKTQVLTDLGTGELMYGEKIKKTRKAKKKAPEISQNQIDLLPDSLKHLANRKTDEG